MDQRWNDTDSRKWNDSDNNLRGENPATPDLGHGLNGKIILKRTLGCEVDQNVSE